MRVPLSCVEWDALSLVEAAAERPLIERRAVLRGGFYEMQARTVIERVAASAGLAQEWGVSPYRGARTRVWGAGRGAGIAGWGWMRGGISTRAWW